MNIGERVKNIRTVKRMTQTELSKKSGVSRIEIHNLEKGFVKYPRMDTVMKLAKAMEVDFFDIATIDNMN